MLLFSALDRATLGLALICLLLAGGGIGLARELARLARPPSKRSPTAPLAPAEGRDGLATLVGARAEPNRVDGRYQRFTGWDHAPTVGRGRRVGGPSPLIGRVVIASMFLGRDGRQWSDAEIAQALAALGRAGAWIGRQAAGWNVLAHIELLDTYFQGVDAAPRGEVELDLANLDHARELMEAPAVVREMAAFSRAAASLGCGDAAELAGRTADFVEGRVDALVWLLHPRDEGRSFVIDHSEAPPGAAVAVCYARESQFPGRLVGSPFPDPVTYAHELLHLFGATDKYGVSLRTFAARSVTGRDIMRLDFEALSRLRIDPLTAAEVGWVS